MDLSVEQKLAINTKVASDLYGSIYPYSDRDGYRVTVIKRSGAGEYPDQFDIFDPEKGDLNKAVEFYGIDVVKDGSYWAARRFIYEYGFLKAEFDKVSEDRTTAIIKAVTAASGANQAKEDE